MSQREYCWQRDMTTGMAVLHWSEDGRTWKGYYRPVLGKVYDGIGQMNKMNELRAQGYVYKEHPSLKREVEVSKDIEYTLDSYGEEDPASTAIKAALDTETDIHAFMRSKNKQDRMREALENATNEEVLDRAIHELTLNLEGASHQDLINFALESFKKELRNQNREEVIKFALDMYRNNDKVQRLKDAVNISR